MSKQPTNLGASQKPCGTLRGKLLGLVALLALLVSVFSPMVAGRTVAAATLSQSVASESGQQWPAGLWQSYQRIHPLTASGTYTQSAEFSATDTANYDNFGWAVSVSSDGATALIGALLHNNTGTAYIFTKSGNVWSQVAELTANDTAATNGFGSAVSLSSDGSTALIGAKGLNSQAGAAYIFTKGSGWITGTTNETAELTASDTASQDYFGSAVSLSNDGSTALIGADGHKVGGYNQAGEAYVFSKNGVWSSGTETAKLTASDAASVDFFGSAVSVSSDGSTVLVGAPYHTVNNNYFGAGEAYVFSKNGVWSSGTETAKLTASVPAANDQLGTAVSISSDGATALIGAPGHSSFAGEAYIFTKGSGWITGSGNETTELTAADATAANDYFGTAVSISSDGATALVGATGLNNKIGAAYIFSTNSGWSSSTQTAKLTPSDGVPAPNYYSAGDAFGSAVSLSSNGVTALISSSNHNSNAGAAYIFTPLTVAATTTTVSSAPNPSVYGQPITFTANVTPITVTGSVNFNLDNSTVYSATLDNMGAASFVTNTLAAGVYTTTASYSGDSNDASSTSSVITQTVSKDDSNVALTVSPTTSNLNQDIVYTATVTAASSSLVPTGSVVFSDTTTGTEIGSANLDSNGVAVLDTTTRANKYLDGGSHNVEAIYSGSSNYNGNTSNSVTVNVNSQSGVVVSSSLNPSVYGQSVTFTATVNITSTGNINAAPSIVGTHTATPQTVAFSIDGKTVAQNVALDGSGVATYITNTLSAGQHGVVATYTGGTNEQDSTSATFTQTVTMANTSTSLTNAPNPSVYGQPITFTANVSPTTATGTVTFNLNDGDVATATLNGSTGVATYVTNTLSAGVYTATASYNGNSNNNASTSAVVTQTVNPANTTTSLTSAPNPSALNQSVTLTATVAAVAPSSGIPTGSVVFTDTTTNTALGSGTLNANGVATISVSTLAVGTHSLTASYAGNANFNGSSAANVNQTVAANGSSLTLTSGPNPSTFGQSVTFTATVSPSAATGNISFTIDSKTVSASLNNGVATYVTSTLVVGSHTATASYAGNSTYGSSTSNTVTQVVNAVQNNNPSYSYFLPFLSNNGAGANIVNMRGVSPKTSNYTTYVSIDNGNSSPVTFTITYYNAQGNVIGTDNNGGNTLASNTRYLPTSPLASGQNASAVVTSNQPLNIVVSESGTVNNIATASSYTAVNVATDATSTIYAPIAINNAYGGYTTNFVLANLGNTSTTATITYYSDNGTSAGTQSVSLAAHAQTNVTQASTGSSNLLSGFSGWAIVSSSGNQPLSGQVVETNPNFSFLETVDMPGMSGKTLYIPTVFQNAFGNFNTGMQLVNPNGTAANVTVSYYRKDGTKITTSAAHGSFSIGANSDTSFYHSVANFPELNTPNGGFVGTAIVTSDQPLVAIVNQAGSLNSVQYNGAFGTVLSGAAKVNIPVAVKDNYGKYITGLQVTNVSNVASTATISYYDQSGNKVYSTTLKSDAGGAIPAYGSANPYLGIESNLPNGFDGVAVVTADTSGAQFVVIANNASDKFFYTYANNS